MLNACGTQADVVQMSALAIGDAAPAFTLANARGGELALDLTQGPTLLSFIWPGTANDEAAQASRSQVVFIKSMAEQYTDQGLQVLLVASATQSQPAIGDAHALLNFSYDWNLDQVPLLIDDGTVARSYGVRELPTTLLIDEAGRVAQRWEGYAGAAQLALAIQAELAAPAANSCAESAAQTPFAGFGPARQLSDQIWLVDGGQPWQAGSAQPTTWIVFSDVATPTLTVSVHEGVGPALPLFNQALVPLDLEVVPPAASLRPFQLTIPMTLQATGCATIQATVFAGTQPIDQGTAIIPIRATDQ